MTKEEKRWRNKIVQKGRTLIDKQLKEGIFIQIEKEKYNIMDVKDVIADKNFLNDIIREIERNQRLKLEENKGE